MLFDFLYTIDVVLGYLHRGTEKLCEFKTIEQSLPYFDRLDYVAVLFNEYIFTVCLENVLRVCLLLRCMVVRVLLNEFTRVVNGLLCLFCMLLDLGCLSPMLFAFEEREKIMTFFDLCLGARIHCAFFVVGGFLDDFFCGLFDFFFCMLLSSVFFCNVLGFFTICNRFFFVRLRGVAIVFLWDVFYVSCSGVFARSCGLL